MDKQLERILTNVLIMGPRLIIGFLILIIVGLVAFCQP